MAYRTACDNGEFTPTYIPEFVTPEKFADKKIKMLREDFGINLSLEDRTHLRKLKTEQSINAAVMAILNKYWG